MSAPHDRKRRATAYHEGHAVARLYVGAPPTEVAGMSSPERKALFMCNSWQRGSFLAGLFPWCEKRLELLGEFWTICDYFPKRMKDIVSKLPRPAWACMDDLEREAYGNLPAVITVWRGCYETNAAGMSWSMCRATAERFPTLLRYRQPGQPRLLEGRIRREDIAFIKLDRKESEIVADPKAVEVVNVIELKVAA
jgi:hypothetical protein